MKQEMMVFGDAVASAGPCANELYMYLAPDKMETAIKLMIVRQCIMYHSAARARLR